MGPASIAVIAAVLLAVSVPAFAEDNYANSLSQRPMPTDEYGRQQECAWIRSEISRQQDLGAVVASQSIALDSALFMAIAQGRVALLETRAATVPCATAFSSGTTQSPQVKPAVSSATATSTPGKNGAACATGRDCEGALSCTNNRCASVGH
jgi:hypothetical protein